MLCMYVCVLRIGFLSRFCSFEYRPYIGFPADLSDKKNIRRACQNAFVVGSEFREVFSSTQRSLHPLRTVC